MDSDEQTEIGGIPVKVSSHRVTDQYEPFDSALELKALPCLSTLICERWHPNLLEFLRETPFVNEVTLLNHGQRTLDLRGTRDVYKRQAISYPCSISKPERRPCHEFAKA